MSFVVRKVGGGNFNPKAMCISTDSQFFFIALGCQINVYALANSDDIPLVETITTHKAHITSLVCDSQYLISADESGMIYWHRLNGITIVNKTPEQEFTCHCPIERLLIRNGKLFYIYFFRRLFWVLEFGNEENSIFRVTNEQQESFIKSMHQGLVMQGTNPLRFCSLDGFDINEDATTVALTDKCKLHIHNFATGQRETYPNPVPVSYVRFRNKNEVVTFLANGMMFIYGGGRIPVRDHWHYACPNAFVTNETSIISGGFEGVLTFFNERTHRHDHLPRLGLTIEGLALSNDGRVIAAVVDKNMLAFIDPSSRAVIRSYSNVTGDISFYKGNLVAVRRPNLVQIFDCRTSKVLTQLQISSFSSNVPVTAVELSDNYMITVETAGGKQPPRLTIGGQIAMNHKRSIANRAVHDYEYEKLLLRDRYAAMKAIKKVQYGQRDGDVTEALEEDQGGEREGNPVMKDADAAAVVDYSEIGIWAADSDAEGGFRLDQSFRVIGKPAHPLAMHPTLSIFAVVVAHELQIWKRGDMWEMFRSVRLPAVPRGLEWSPDGSILLARYSSRIDLIDADTMTTAASHTFEARVSMAKFISDCEIAVHTALGMAVFDVRSLSETRLVFAMAACADACEGAFAFAINKDQPVVVLSDGGRMVSWQVTTSARIAHIHIVRSGGRCRIAAVDEDNFVWSIDEFGIEEKAKARTFAVSAPRPREGRRAARVELRRGAVPELIELLSAPSHQILAPDLLAKGVFEAVLEPRRRKEAAAVPVAIPTGDDEVENVEPTEYNARELSEMRGALNLN